MKKYLIFCSVLVLTASFKSNEPLVLDLYFKNATIFLSEDNELLLDEAIEKAALSNLQYQISLEAFPIEEEALSRKRVEAVVDYLAEANTKVDKILYFSDPKHVPNDVKAKTDWSFLRLTIEYETPTIVAQKKTTTAKKIKKYYEPVMELTENKKVFDEISNFSEITLKSVKGNKVKIEPQSFVFEDGSLVTSPIEITIKDATSKEEAILEGLTTMTESGEMLESQGMIYVNATSGGRQLKLAKGKSLTFNVQTEAPKEGFQSYTSTISADGQINWFLSEAPKVEIKKEKEKRYYKLTELTERELAELAVKRAEMIAKWEDRGMPKKMIRQRLRKLRRKVKQRNKMKKAKRQKISRKIERRQPRIMNYEILGKTKYHYVEYEPKGNPKISYMYELQSNSLGWTNIDKLMKKADEKPPCDLYVKADEDTNVKVIFKRNFGVFNGVKEQDGFVFPNFPSTMKVTVLATKKMPNGQIKYAYKTTELEDKTVVFEDYEVVSSYEFAKFLKKYAL